MPDLNDIEGKIAEDLGKIKEAGEALEGSLGIVRKLGEERSSLYDSLKDITDTVKKQTWIALKYKDAYEVQTSNLKAMMMLYIEAKGGGPLEIPDEEVQRVLDSYLLNKDTEGTLPKFTLVPKSLPEG